MKSWLRKVWDGARGRFGRKPPRQYPLRPELSLIKILLMWFLCGVSVASAVHLIGRLCLPPVQILPSNLLCDYLALVALPIGVYAYLYLQNDLRVHDSRVLDRSKVEALFVEANKLYPRVGSGDDREPRPFEDKVSELQDEVARLKNEVGPKAWTEYQLLSLDQMLVDFLKVDDLKERARSVLEDLEEYAVGYVVAYDLRKYDRWETRINSAIERIPEKSAANEDQLAFGVRRDASAERLRAVLKSLQDHVASFEAYWAEGTTIVRGLIILCCFTIPTLVAMGLLPILRPGTPIGILNWTFFGVAGALTAVLRGLFRLDVVEVGATEGRAELWRTMIGCILGLMAGVLTYSLVAGGVVESTLVPEPGSSNLKNVALSILWATASGFWLERTFERVRAATGGA